MNKIVFLGCGHSEAMEHFNNNALVKGEQGHLLIDCGYTIKYALQEQNLSINDIDAIFITHVHGDHVFGLERMAYESRFKYKHRIKLFLHQSLYSELWDQTLKGSMSKLGEGTATLEDFFDVEVLTENEFSFDKVNYQLFSVRHTPEKPCFGLFINKKVIYTSDTTAIPDKISKFQYDVCFHDVTLTSYNPVHATLDSLLEVYGSEQRKKMYLMSYEDHWREYQRIVEREFAGFVKQGKEFFFD